MKTERSFSGLQTKKGWPHPIQMLNKNKHHAFLYSHYLLKDAENLFLPQC